MAGSTTQVAYSDQAASLLVQSESRNIWQVGRTVSQAILPIFCILWWREAQLLVAKRERWRASLPGWWIKKWMKGWKILPRGRSLNGMHLQREIEMPLLPKVHPDKATLPEESSHFLIWSLSAVLFTILSSSDLGSWSRSQEKRDDHSKGEGSDQRRWWRRPLIEGGWIGWDSDLHTWTEWWLWEVERGDFKPKQRSFFKFLVLQVGDYRGTTHLGFLLLDEKSYFHLLVDSFMLSFFEMLPPFSHDFRQFDWNHFPLSHLPP